MKITAAEAERDTEHYVMVSYDEPVYIIDENGMCTQKFDKGQLVKVSAEECLKQSNQ